MIDVHGTDPWNVDESRCGFIRTCYKENIGWYALALCICGANYYAVLQTFCGIHTSLDNQSRRNQHYRRRCDVVDVDTDKLKHIMNAEGISQRTLAELLNVKRSFISRMMTYEPRKRKAFVEKVEKALHLPSGALIKKEGTK